MRILHTLLYLGCTVCLQAQTLSPTVVASAGGHFTAGGVSMSYTVGEMAMVKTFGAGNIILTQGFHQPAVSVTGMLESERTDNGSFAVYPNPAGSEVWIGYEFPEQGKVVIKLLNALGQAVKDILIDENYLSGKNIEAVDVSMIAAGNYFLQANFVGNSGKKKALTRQLHLHGY